MRNLKQCIVIKMEILNDAIDVHVQCRRKFLVPQCKTNKYELSFQDVTINDVGIYVGFQQRSD